MVYYNNIRDLGSRVLRINVFHLHTYFIYYCHLLYLIFEISETIQNLKTNSGLILGNTNDAIIISSRRYTNYVPYEYQFHFLNNIISINSIRDIIIKSNVYVIVMYN